MTERAYITVDRAESPRLIQIADVVSGGSDQVIIQDLHDTLNSNTLPAGDSDDSLDNMDDDFLIDSAGKEELGGGILVGITATLQNAQIAFDGNYTASQTGTATSADPSGEILVDTAATFEANGVSRGDWLVNFSDRSVTEVLRVLSEITLEHRPLQSGSGNDWDIGDAYAIFAIIQKEVSGGNIVAADDVGDPLSSVFTSFATQVVRTASSSATLQEQADIQYASFDGGVTIDVTSIYSGTAYPVGTPRQPVNNLADALTILQGRGFDTFYIRDSLTVSAGTYPYLFRGQAVSVSDITLDAGPDLTNARFERLTVTGTLDGDAGLNDCFIETLNFFNGVIYSCVLSGTVTLGGNVQAVILDSWSDTGGATIDLGGSGQDLMIQNFHGALTLTNKTGADTADIGISSGEITIDNSVTNGIITLSGVGRWTNELTYSGGATIVNHLLTVDDTQQIIFGGGVTIDTTGGTSGVSYPIGTPRHPVDNIPDAITIAIARGLDKLFIIGNITLGAGDDVSDYIISGQNAGLTTITSGAASVTTNSQFTGCTLTGSFDSGIIVRDSIVNNISGVSGILFNTMMLGNVTLANGLPTYLLSCYCGGGAPTIDMGGTGQDLLVKDFNGEIDLINQTGADTLEFDMNSGQIILNATITNGNITARGVGRLVDSGGNDVRTGSFGGATVVNDMVSAQEVVATIDESTYDGKEFSAILADLLAMANGRIEENPAGTYTFFEQDNTTSRFVLIKSGAVRSRV